MLNERHLVALLTEFVRYYNRHRPHRALEFEKPVPSQPTSYGAIVTRPILGGLHHSDARAA
jgi:transposase InsO family protein